MLNFLDLMFLCSLLGGALIIWFHISHRQLITAAKNIPSVLPTWPIFGHSYIVFQTIEEMGRQLVRLSTEAVSKGFKTSVFWCGPLPLFISLDLNDIGIILNSSKTSEKSMEYEFFSNTLNMKGHYHLLNAPNNVWRKTRRYVNPLFHADNLQHMEPVFNTNCHLLVQGLAEHVGRGDFDVFTHSMSTGLLSVCNLMFGSNVQIDANSKEFENLMKFVERVPDLFTKMFYRPWLRIHVIFQLFYKNDLQDLNSRWREFTESTLQIVKDGNKTKSESCKRNSNVSEGIKDASEEESIGRLNIVDVYTILQQNFPEFNEKDLLIEVAGFFCTGTDTIAAGLSSCLLALAQYQDIQERLYQEVIAVVERNKDVTLEDLNRMPYLDQVIKETLRWFMIVPYTVRKSSKEIELGSCTIPADSTIMVSLAAVHMDPKIYPEPHIFDPDRFSPSNTANNDKFSFLPFSAGPRNCIAKTYALRLMKMAVVHILRRFQLHTKMDIHKLQRKLVITLVSTEGYVFSLQNRDSYII